MLQPLQEVALGSSLPPETEQADMWDVAAHEPIVTALESGDAEAARAAMRAHFDYVDPRTVRTSTPCSSVGPPHLPDRATTSDSRPQMKCQLPF